MDYLCSICLEETNANFYECEHKHKTHAHCINQYLVNTLRVGQINHKVTCPICRGDIFGVVYNTPEPWYGTIKLTTDSINVIQTHFGVENKDWKTIIPQELSEQLKNRLLEEQVKFYLIAENALWLKRFEKDPEQLLIQNTPKRLKIKF